MATLRGFGLIGRNGANGVDTLRLEILRNHACCLFSVVIRPVLYGRFKDCGQDDGCQESSRNRDGWMDFHRSFLRLRKLLVVEGQAFRNTEDCRCDILSESAFVGWPLRTTTKIRVG
jgi:hypothetical protein